MEATGQLGHGRAPSDGGHDALVPVAERPGRLPGQPPADVHGGVAAALDRHLGHLGELLAVPTCRGGQSPMTNTSGWPGSDRSAPTGMVPPRPFSPGISSGHRVGLHPRGPDHGAGRQRGAVVECDPFGRHPGQAEPEAHVDALALEGPQGGRCEAGENPGSRWSVISTRTTRAAGDVHVMKVAGEIVGDQL